MTTESIRMLIREMLLQEIARIPGDLPDGVPAGIPIFDENGEETSVTR